MYDLGCEDEAVSVNAHPVVYGELRSVDASNWIKKIEIVSSKAGYAFDQFEGGRDEFMEEFTRFFFDPRRFSYTPVICARGRKPAA